MADVQIEVINTTENVVNVAVPGVQGPVGSTGSVTIAQAGTAATPGIRFESDTNTGIYSPGADQLAVSTGGTGRLFVDASGNVGVGTSSPGARLQVNAPSTGRSYSSSVLDFSNIHLDGITSNSTTSALTFSSGNGGGAAIAFSRGGSFETEISFWTNSTATTNSATERLRINSSGNVGVGTSSPRGLVSISNNVSGTGVVDSSLHFGFSTLDYYGFRIVNSNEPASTAAGLLKFQRGNAASWVDALVISNFGNVGVGTSSPGYKLTVQSDSASTVFSQPYDNYGLVVRNDNATNNTYSSLGFIATSTASIDVSVAAIAALCTDHTTGSVDGELGFFTTGNNIISERLRIDSSGKMGIGTTSPTTLLDVNADTVRVRTARTPASATATGATGEICWDASYIYVCTATNTWKRSALSTW